MFTNVLALTQRLRPKALDEPFAGADKVPLAHRRRHDKHVKGALERQITRVDAILIGVTIAAVAYADRLSGPTLSMGYLYLIPLSYSALSQSPWTTVGLVTLCVGLRQWLSPLELSPTAYFIRDWVLTGVFVSLVAALGRLGHRRRLFFETARRQRDELLQEMEMAAELQQNLIESNRPPETRFDTAARMEPAKEVGGDYYDFVSLHDGSLGIVVADVAGKGLAAAMLMPAVDIAMQAIAQKTIDPSETLKELNRILYENTGRASYATVFFSALCLKTGVLRYANGGHLPGLLLKRNGRPEWLSTGGTPVGLLPDASFESGAATLEKGDILVLYSDGVTEAENAEGESFGEERLTAAVLVARDKSSAEIADIIEGTVEGFRAADAARDDATVIVIKNPL